MTEELASGCLTTTFVWLQHRGLAMTLAAEGTPAALRDQWLGPACRGQVRGGIALTGIIPGPPLLRARPAGGGWQVDGEAPWVTGWGLIDLLLVLARGPQDSIVTLILDAAAQPGLTVTRQRLAAVNASVTVRLGFDGVLVPAERFAGQAPFDPAESLRPDRMRINGSLALGLVSRCARLLGPGPLDDELAACRERLDEAITADATAMAEARAAASELAVRATAALAVRDGSRSVTVDQHAAAARPRGAVPAGVRVTAGDQERAAAAVRGQRRLTGCLGCRTSLVRPSTAARRPPQRDDPPATS